MIHRHALCNIVWLAAIVLTASSAWSADPETDKPERDKLTGPKVTAPEAKAGAVDQAARDKKFEEMLSGAVLTGNYTSGQKNPGPLKEDKYTIEKVSKLQGDVWLFNVRIQYGGKDVTVPLPLTVLWAGDTPMITLDKSLVPGMGEFSARVVFHEGKYAGTWSGANHGGHLFGTIAKETDKKDAEKKDTEKKDGAPAEKSDK
jgi:hypothetical protein